MSDTNNLKDILGLNENEVLESRLKYGDNKLSSKKKESFWEKFKGTFDDPIIKILLLAVSVSLTLSLLSFYNLTTSSSLEIGVTLISVTIILLLVKSLEIVKLSYLKTSILIALISIAVFYTGSSGIIKGEPEWIESLGIIIAVLLSTLISTINEYKQDNKASELKEQASKILVKVYRDGNLSNVLIDEVVVGDYVLLQSGDRVSADGYIVKGKIKVDNSVLNGETEENKKEAVEDGYVYDSKIEFTDIHKAYRGSLVLNGEAILLVTNVGSKTEMGKIALSLAEEEEVESPLTLKLKKLAKMISTFGYIGASIASLAYLAFNYIHPELRPVSISGFTELIVNSFTLGLIIVVMSVPEGLPLMIALVLSQNMEKMLNDNVLVRKMLGIETAGNVKIIFTDKTGTLTKGVLSVVEFFNDLGKYTKYDDIDEGIKKELALACCSNNGASYTSDLKVVGGNSTDRALLEFIDKNDVCKFEIVEKEPFDSAKKYSAVYLNNGVSYYKGAPEKLLHKCGLSKEELDSLTEHMDELANRSIRVLCVAKSDEKIKEGEIPNLKLIGLLGIRDDIRPDAMKAVSEIKKAGIKVCMITGDKKETAVAIAKEIGIILNENDIALTSEELSKLSDNELDKIIENICVVARATPMDKLRLMKAAQNRNLVCAMTGDGVNDSPALNKADVGFAMGSGTEAAKDASDIIILDDTFASIDKAVLYGRTIYRNIQKFIRFQLAINVSAVLISVIMPFLGVESPLSIIQFLWINLVMDTLGALAFGNEPALKEYMQEKPKDRNEDILSNKLKAEIVFSGLTLAILGMVILLYPNIPGLSSLGDFSNSKERLTVFFCYFIFAALANGATIRSNSVNILKNISKNKMFMNIYCIIVVTQILMVTFIGNVIGSVPLTTKQWIVAVVFALIVIPLKMLFNIVFESRKA